MCVALNHEATSRPLWSTQHLPIDSSSLWEPQCLPIDSSAWQTVRAVHTMIHGAQHWPQIPQMVRMVRIFTTIISWGQHYQLCQSSTAVSFNRSRFRWQMCGFQYWSFVQVNVRSLPTRRIKGIIMFCTICFSLPAKFNLEPVGSRDPAGQTNIQSVGLMPFSPTTTLLNVCTVKI